jgi:hypothetical protein
MITSLYFSISSFLLKFSIFLNDILLGMGFSHRCRHAARLFPSV